MTLQWKNVAAISFTQDEKLQAEWDRLNATRGDLPILSAQTIALALRIFGSGSERLLIGRDNSRIDAMFVMVRTKRMQWETFQPSQLPLGAWVADAEHELQTLALEMSQQALSLALSVSITQIDPLVAERKPDTDRIRHSEYIDTGWIDLQDAGDFETYWAARGKNLRQNMRKQRNKLASDGIALNMKVLRQPEDMASAIAQYGQMESAGWKAENGTSIHPDNPQGRFYQGLLEDASRRGEAVVYMYLFDDKVVAINLCLLRLGKLIVLKTTYDESIKQFSPAFLLRETELQEIFAEGQIKRIEYFGRLMDWHTKLTDNKRTIYHLTVYRWPMIKRFVEGRRARLEASPAASQLSQEMQSYS